jgi:hypothetical protein
MADCAVRPIYAEVSATAEGQTFPNPPAGVFAPRTLEKAIILARLSDEQLSQAMALMTVRQQERWRVPGYPNINVDDAELLAMRTAIGVDPDPRAVITRHAFLSCRWTAAGGTKIYSSPWSVLLG